MVAPHRLRFIVAALATATPAIAADPADDAQITPPVATMPPAHAVIPDYKTSFPCNESPPPSTVIFEKRLYQLLSGKDLRATVSGKIMRFVKDPATFQAPWLIYYERFWADGRWDQSIPHAAGSLDGVWFIDNYWLCSSMIHNNKITCSLLYKSANDDELIKSTFYNKK